MTPEQIEQMRADMEAGTPDCDAAPEQWRFGSVTKNELYADLRRRMRVPQLEAEVLRLREALELSDAALSGANMNMNVVQRKVKSALKGSDT